MPNYRRSFRPGGTFFFTVVTRDRQPIHCTDRARPLLRRAIHLCRERWPFDVDGFILMPDHLHSMWTLPEDDTDYSRRLAWIKREFTSSWLAAGGEEAIPLNGHFHQRRRGVWQPRFWEHTIRDEDDRNRHLDYMHYNPVKHGYAECPHDWPYSSFHRQVTLQNYPRDWQCRCNGGTPAELVFDGLPVDQME
jgi:putative transposase